MQMEPFGWDLFLRHTNPSGDSYVASHRAWDKERFLAARRADAEKVNRDQKEGAPRLAAIQQITEEQYRTERKPK